MSKARFKPIDRQLAKAVESAVFQSLLCAQEDPSREDHWRRHADMLEHNYTTDYGRHYASVLYDSPVAPLRGGYSS